MNRIYRFFAKQGQHNRIAILLAARYGKPKMEPRSEGVFLTLALPPGVSKRAVDQYLFANKIPGSVSRRNKMLVIRSERDGWIDKYKVRERVGYDNPFILFDRSIGQMRRVKLVLHDCGCDCCGSWDEIESA